MKRLSYSPYFPLIIPPVVLVGLEIFLYYNKAFYAVSAVLPLIVFLSIWRIGSEAGVKWSWLNFSIFPVLLQFGVMFYSAFAAGVWLSQIIFFANAFLLYFYLKICLAGLLKGEMEEGMSENISSFGNFLVFFMFASAAYGLAAFLNVSIWTLSLFLVAAIALIVYQVLWANGVALRTGLIYIFVFCFVLAELFWSISFLPFNFNVSGLLLAVCYYMLIGLTRHYLLDKLDRKLVKLYLTSGLASILLILLTARWL